MKHLKINFLIVFCLSFVVGCGDSEEGEPPCEVRQKHCEMSQEQLEQCKQDQKNAVEEGCGDEYKELQRCEINACRGAKSSADCIPTVNAFDECMGL